MAKRTVTVDDAEIAAVDARLEAELERELQQRAAKDPTPMDPAAKARLEAAEKKAADAEKKATDAVARLEALESCQKVQEADGKARLESEQAETLRRATLLAGARVPVARVEAEAKRLAAMGRDAVDELLLATPAPRADPLLARPRLEAADGGKPAVLHFARREEDVPGSDRPTVALTVTDWSKYGAKSPLGHPTHTVQEAMPR